jgi:hypothetical protein
MTDKSIHSLHILSNKQSINPNSGSLIVNGGVGINKNVYVKNEIVCNELITKNSTKICKDLHIDGCIIPHNKNQLLGTVNNKWNHMYSNNITADHLDITNNISLGTTTHKLPIIKIDDDIPDTIIINGITVSRSDNGKVYFKLNKKEGSTDIYGSININNYICQQPQIINIEHINNNVNIDSSLVLINIEVQGYLSINNDLPNNCKVRFVIIESNISNPKLTIHLNDKDISLTKIDEWIEVLYYNKRFIIIGTNKY